jgi:pimeloyl-ACP methyl ester carboxylesterase
MKVEDGPGRVLLGLGSLLAGLVGLVIGIGVGVRWVVADVITAKTILALVALIAGLILTVLGIRLLIRGLRPTARLLTASLIALASIVAVWTLTPAVIATNVPPSPGPTGSIDVGAEGRAVRFTTADGVTLWGWYVPPSEGKAVILRHGSGSTASAVVPHARVLVDHGYGVLLTDARGHGQSEGTAMDFGWHGDADTAAAVDFLVGQPEVDADRIAVVGMSMGGEEAIGAAGSDERIAAVVAEGATARTDQDKTWLIEAYGWRGRVQVGLEWLQYGFTELLSGSERPISLAEAAAGASPTPILMITGGSVPDEGQAAAHVQGAADDNVSVWTVPGAGHIQGLSVSPEEWEQVVIGFLDQALASAAS